MVRFLTKLFNYGAFSYTFISGLVHFQTHLSCQRITWKCKELVLKQGNVYFDTLLTKVAVLLVLSHQNCSFCLFFVVIFILCFVLFVLLFFFCPDQCACLGSSHGTFCIFVSFASDVRRWQSGLDKIWNMSTLAVIKHGKTLSWCDQLLIFFI